MEKEKPPKRTLVERFGGGETGEARTIKLIELFARGLSYRQIAKAMPEVFVSHNAVASLKRDWRQEIERLITAYMVVHGPVPQMGASKPFPEADHGARAEPELPARTAVLAIDREAELLLAREAVLEWERLQPRFSKYAYAAMRINQARITGGIRSTIASEEVERLLRKQK